MRSFLAPHPTTLYLLPPLSFYANITALYCISDLQLLYFEQDANGGYGLALQVLFLSYTPVCL
jgi:hypothetical protein